MGTEKNTRDSVSAAKSDNNTGINQKHKSRLVGRKARIFWQRLLISCFYLAGMMMS